MAGTRQCTALSLSTARPQSLHNMQSLTHQNLIKALTQVYNVYSFQLSKTTSV